MLWDRRFFPEILRITGDSGARFLLGKHPEAVAESRWPTMRCCATSTRPNSLNTLPQRMRPETIG